MENKILATYNELLLLNDDLDDEFMMFIAIYKHFNFKDNGCPYYHINKIKTQLSNTNTTLINIPDFKPKYNLFLQEIYDLLFDWIFKYKIMSTKIKKVILNFKVNFNNIQFEIYNNKSIKELISSIANYYKINSNNILIKKNNMILDTTKYIIEYNLDSNSSLTLYFNQYG